MWAFIKRQKGAQQEREQTSFSTSAIIDHLQSLSKTSQKPTRRTTKMIQRMEKFHASQRKPSAKNYVLLWANKAMNKARLLKDGTSTGLDDIPPELVKYAPYQLFLCLAIFAADAADLDFFPPEVEDGWLALIYKKHGLPRLRLNSYRGLRITSVPGKSVASMIGDSIFPMRDDVQPAICKEQFAGKRKHSADMLAIMIQFLKHSRGKEPMYLLLMDIAKAFDRVNRDIIWAKLLQNGSPIHHVAWMRALYRHLRTRVRTSDGFSDFVEMFRGIGQGDPNSTALYAAFLSDLPTHLRNAGLGWNFHGI